MRQLALFSGQATFAQFDKGTAYLAAGSNLGFISAKVDGSQSASNVFYAGLKAVTFVDTNFMLGALLDYASISSTNSSGTGDIKVNTLGVNLSFGIYFGRKSENLN